MEQVERGILHSGTASAITRSLINQCRDTDSATSTGKQCLQLRLQGNEVEEAPIRFEVDQKIEVVPHLPTRHGAEDTDVVCTVACGDIADPIPLGLDSLLRSPPRSLIGEYGGH